MRKPAIIVSLLVLTQIHLLGQRSDAKTNAIDIYAYRLDSIKSKIDSFHFYVDSIQIDASVQKNKVVASCIFEQSKSSLIINFYSKNNDLVTIEIREKSPLMDDLYYNSVFYYNKGNLFDEKYTWKIRTCMGIPMDKSIYELYGYNPKLNPAFLKQFVLLLYNKIKLMPLH